MINPCNETMEMTREEMLEYRRMCAGFGHSDTECDVERYDGVDIDAMLEAQTRQWYLDLLDRGEERLLDKTDVSPMVTVTGSDATGVEVSLPPGVRRVFSVRLAGWNRQARVMDKEKAGEIMARQLNRYAAATIDSPEACLTGNHTLMLYPACHGPLGEPQVEMLTGAFDYGPHKYVIDEAALDRLGKLDIIV